MSPEHRLRGVVVNVRGPDPAQQVQPTQSIEALPPPPAQMGRYSQRLYPSFAFKWDKILILEDIRQQL